MYEMTMEWSQYDPYESMEACAQAAAEQYGATVVSVKDVLRFWEVKFSSPDRDRLVRIAVEEGGSELIDIEEGNLIEEVT